jgi:1-acyl-sn-glycerol-3-phosphate acyltransferase
VHLSHADPAAVGCTSPRCLWFMAKEELFRVPVFGRLIRSVGAFPVDRAGADAGAVRRAIARLDSGGALLVFPEGRRGDGEALLPLQPGIAVLSRRPGVRVVPVGLAGTSTLLPKGSGRPRRSRVTVLYGPAIEVGDLPKAEALERIAAAMGQAQADTGQPFRSGRAVQPGSGDRSGPPTNAG